jgi:hypothetical protein
MILKTDDLYFWQKGPKCKRFFRVYGNDFGMCVNIGEKGYVVAEHHKDICAMFYYFVYGSGRIGKIYTSNYLILDGAKQKFNDVQDFKDDNVVFESFEDFHMIGFCSLDTEIRWKSKMITNKNPEIIVESEKEYLVCLEGNPIINGKKLKRYDCAEVYPNSVYNLDIQEDCILGLFGKIKL